jgi:branched-chain amino acid transport system substrate-binding protein
MEGYMKNLTGMFAAIMLLLSCGSAIAAGTLKIGGLFSVTGPASFLGEPEKKTLELLVKEVNSKGGINGMKLEAVIYDTAGDATKAVQLATKLIKDDKVSVIIGPSTTGESMAIIPVVEKEKIPLISCAAGIKITDPAKHWVFKTPANDHIAAEKILNFMAAQKQKNIALLTVTDGFGSSGREQLKALAKSKGFTIVADEVYGPKDTDMTAQLTKIRGIKPDAIICWGTNPGPAVITKNVKQLGIKVPLYMSHGVASKKFIELAGIDAAEGVMLPAGKLAIYDMLPKNDPQYKLLKEYDQSYKKDYGVEASTFGGYAYDAFLLVTSAIKKTGTTPEQIRNGIEQAQKLVSVSGVFNMSPKDHNGLDLSAFEMVRIVKGDWTMIK